MYSSLSIILILAILIVPWVVIIVKSTIQKSRFTMMLTEMDDLRRRIDMLEEYIQENSAATMPQPHAPDESIAFDDAYVPMDSPRTQASSARGIASSQHSPMESWVGRNVTGIVASILVFIGLVLLGILIVPFMTDGMKIGAMFIISIILATGGGALNKRVPNAFTEMLLGCGCGAFFVSIMMTHLFFHVLPDVAAFSLIIVWMIACFFVVRWTQSILVSVVCHIGMTISLCFAYIGGIADDRLLLLLCYQAASTATICLGNLFCCKRTYRFGLFASSAMALMASAALWNRYIGTGADFASSLPAAAITAAFIFQFIGSTFLSYLLFVSALRLEKPLSRIAAQAVNMLLWIAAICLDVIALTIKLYFVQFQPESMYLGTADNFMAITIGVAIGLALVALFVACMILLRSRLEYPADIQRVSLSLALVFGAVLLLVHYGFAVHYQAFVLFHAPWLLLAACAFLAMERFTRDSFYLPFAYGCLALDATIMTLFGYGDMHAIGLLLSADARIFEPIVFLYLAATVAIIYLSYHLCTTASRYHELEGLKMGGFFAFEIPFLSFIYAFNLLSIPPIVIALPALCVIVARTRFIDTEEDTSTKPNALFASMRINEYLVGLWCAFTVTLNNPDVLTSNGLLTLHRDPTFTFCNLIAVGLILYVMWLRVKRARETDMHAYESLSGLTFTMTVLCWILGNTDWLTLDQGYLFSVVCMLTALLCIVVGFWQHAAPLRLYGLVVTLLCVAKLVVLDIGGVNSLLHVAAFIGGGLICFAVSALYNYAAKRLGN